MRDYYNRRLENILSQYGVESESEAFSGCIRKLGKQYTQRKEVFDAKLLIRERLKNLTKETRQRFFEEFGGEQQIMHYSRDMLAKASAWYNVTYQEEEAPYLGFPWVVSDLVLRIPLSMQRYPLWCLKAQSKKMQNISSDVEQFASEASNTEIRGVISAEIRQSRTRLRFTTQNILRTLKDEGSFLRFCCGISIEVEKK